MNFAQAISSGFGKYVQFGGRASRSEYWYWTLFAVIVSIVANIIDCDARHRMVSTVVGLGLFCRVSRSAPAAFTISIGRSGGCCSPSRSSACSLLIYWACLRGTSGPNRFGPDPL